MRPRLSAAAGSNLSEKEESMAEKFLQREDAPFGDAVWQRIDEAVTGAAKSQLAARKLLYIDGPHGLGLRHVPGPDRAAGESGAPDAIAMLAAPAIPVTLLRGGFRLGVRDVAAFEQAGAFLDVNAPAAAAIAVARQEDDAIFNGAGEVKGLLNAGGVQYVSLGSWDSVGAAANDVIGAATRLDAAGFHGPYALGLSPGLFNKLFRLYPQANLTEFQHLQTLVTEGIVKVAAIKAGGLLLASGRQFATIVVGQDLAARFEGTQEGTVEFSVIESIALRLLRPDAVCVLRQ